MKVDSSASGDAKLGSELIIAIDFGTTYSGVSYCFTRQRDAAPVSILSWPGSEGVSAPKVPTLIKYAKDDPSIFEWGASVQNSSGAISGIKLLLDPTQERPIFLPTISLKRELKALPKSPVNVVADYIGAIYYHALSEISKTVPRGYIDTCDIEHVLSVPAVWSDAAKNATLSAASLAGLDNITLIKEPEAAALFTARSLSFSIQPKDAFVICDAGGGTVDLVSHEVEKTEPRLQLKELVPGSGGMSGSLGLNRRFTAAVEDLVEEAQWTKLTKTRALFLAERQFDREVKSQFRGNTAETYFVNFPMAGLMDDPDMGLEGNCWTMTGSDVTAIYEPLVRDILRLIDEQVQAVKLKRSNVSGIILVGGFGASQYLRRHIEKAYPDIQVLQPNDAWAAISKGAALSRPEHEAIVMSICAPRHYGVIQWTPYDPEVDQGQSTMMRRDGVRRAEHIKWYIHKGDDLRRDQKIRFAFFRCIKLDFMLEDLIWTDHLYACEDRVAPVHRSKANKIFVNCTLTSNLVGVPASKFIRQADQRNGHSEEGIPHYKVFYQLVVVSMESAMMKFSLEIDGEEMGSVDVKYNH